jgi:hypothetical protein
MEMAQQLETATHDDGGNNDDVCEENVTHKEKEHDIHELVHRFYSGYFNSRCVSSRWIKILATSLPCPGSIEICRMCIKRGEISFFKELRDRCAHKKKTLCTLMSPLATVITDWICPDTGVCDDDESNYMLRFLADLLPVKFGEQYSAIVRSISQRAEKLPLPYKTTKFLISKAAFSSTRKAQLVGHRMVVYDKTYVWRLEYSSLLDSIHTDNMTRLCTLDERPKNCDILARLSLLIDVHGFDAFMKEYLYFPSSPQIAGRPPHGRTPIKDKYMYNTFQKCLFWLETDLILACAKVVADATATVTVCETPISEEQEQQQEDICFLPNIVFTILCDANAVFGDRFCGALDRQ